MTQCVSAPSSCVVEGEIQGKKIRFEGGWIAKQANGSCMVRMGETVVFSAATAGDVRDFGFMPLMVDYRQKTSAAGKFPGGFIKREGRPGDEETLISRLIDRPIRPLFPENWIYDTQVLCTVYSFDNENPTDVLVMNAASAAVHASDMPFAGPVGSLRIGRIGGEFIAFPTYQEIEKSDINLILSGTREGIVMVEAGMEIVSEEDVLAAFDFALPHIASLIDLQEEFRSKVGREKKTWDLPEVEKSLFQKVDEWEPKVREVFFTSGKHARYAALGGVRKEMVEALCPKDEQGNPLPGTPSGKDVNTAWVAMIDRLVREYVFEGKRSDGRTLTEIRPIDVQIGLLPRTHGSALFTRGETQAMVMTTLGTGKDEQIIDGMREEYSKRFMLHYNFPPFSVGETKPVRGPGRREIGHGALAERALLSVMPDEDAFPYTVRVISDIMESNGSSSMASVCGGCLAMMDAGVPLKAPVAGIAMGLIYDSEEKVAVLTDILGDEDHHGDMDFKVAGTEEGITALQMDLKAAGIPMPVVRKALAQAREGRLEILGRMKEAIASPREVLSPYAPRHEMVRINTDKIGLIIGPGGKTIREIEATSGATIEVENDGTVKIYARDADGMEKASEMIHMLTDELEIGTIYAGKVVSIKDFGAFVEITGRGMEGLVHVTEITEAYVDRVEDFLERDMEVEVKLLSREDSGKFRFSIKAARSERGQEPLGRLDGKPVEARPERSGGGGERRFRDSRPRGGGRGRDRDRRGGGGRDRDRRGGGAGGAGGREKNQDPRDF